MKAAWIRNFWTKAVAFLLAAALVPVILTYVVGLVYSYGGMGKDFYTSDLCLYEVGKKTWEICDDYIAMEGGDYELDKIYPKGNSYSNLRFRVTDEQDKVEFSNVSDGDTFCYSTVYVDKTFDVYLVKDLPAQDGIYWAKVFYDKAERWGQNALELLILFGTMELFLLIFLARTAARREDGELQGGWQEKIPFDLYLLVDGTIIALLCVAVEGVYSYVSFYTPPYDVLLLAMSFALAVLVFAAWVTFCARVKVGGLWKGTIVYSLLCLCWKIVKWCWGVLCAFGRGMMNLLHAIPMIWRTVVLCILVSVATMILAGEFYYGGVQLIVLLLVLSVAACLFSLQLRKLQREGEALASGDLDAQVDTKWMYWDVKRHAENLNSIGDGMAAAIDKQLKSERLKTELITNVSHDIKTPLTSIINYVDLLQHEHTSGQEEEYLAVLKRQAFKLKKLTEDLVEASKATTGNLPVNAVRCSMNELLAQVEGEYGDKLAAAELTLVSVMPEKELFCCVDGALMWRVIDNLLSNICKYAQNGTRVYLTLDKTGGEAVVTFKNTSRAALNIPAEELMERFVRGDSSRSTEGNGLGLSIAQSLTELQGGKMALAIDGDLFKAILRFPTVA
mgnify:FL=1